ncbi:TetR/AcrR family transcriptional regulator [Phenylobacterium sp.]|uniref:TetR/AcrR family transcriptional regulator n=1 Tax=Phenylobacterium sp. TaxID=1871053 RepID=UPI0025D0F424|nr:TetR/AcrR family transcriptional regulator [Phenylobacterium sp.]
MTQPSPQRPDRRRVRTRAALLRAGQELFAARSVDGVSIDDIVGAADVAKGSFYNHFPDKDALARTLADEARRQVEALAAHMGAGVDDPAERVARALCGFTRQAAEQPEAARLGSRLFQGAAIPDLPMDRGVRADIQAGLQSGRFRGLSLEAGVLMAVGVVQIAVARALDTSASGPPSELARELGFGLLRGLGLDPPSAAAVSVSAADTVFGLPALPA